MKETDLLAWIDIETTGLDPLHDDILEVACIITTQDLFEISRKEWVIHPGRAVFINSLVDMPDVVRVMHTESGLIDEVHDHGMPVHHWVDEFIEFLDEALFVNSTYEKFVMAGSGVARFDYTWFQFNFQKILEKFQYYCFDVGILRRALVIAGSLEPLENKSLAHRAMLDIEDHLQEWNYYRMILEPKDEGKWEAWIPNAWRTDAEDES